MVIPSVLRLAEDILNHLVVSASHHTLRYQEAQDHGRGTQHYGQAAEPLGTEYVAHDPENDPHELDRYETK